MNQQQSNHDLLGRHIICALVTSRVCIMTGQCRKLLISGMLLLVCKIVFGLYQHIQIDLWFIGILVRTGLD